MDIQTKHTVFPNLWLSPSAQSFFAFFSLFHLVMQIYSNPYDLLKSASSTIPSSAGVPIDPLISFQADLLNLTTDSAQETRIPKLNFNASFLYAVVFITAP